MSAKPRSSVEVLAAKQERRTTVVSERHARIQRDAPPPGALSRTSSRASSHGGTAPPRAATLVDAAHRVLEADGTDRTPVSLLASQAGPRTGQSVAGTAGMHSSGRSLGASGHFNSQGTGFASALYGSYLTDGGSHAADSTVDTEASVSDTDSLEVSSSSATSDDEDLIYYGEAPAPKPAAARKEKWRRLVVTHEPDEEGSAAESLPADDEPDNEAIDAANTKYQALLQAKQEDPTRWVNAQTQTIAPYTLSVDCQCLPPALQSSECQATIADVSESAAPSEPQQDLEATTAPQTHQQRLEGHMPMLVGAMRPSGADKGFGKRASGTRGQPSTAISRRSMINPRQSFSNDPRRSSDNAGRRMSQRTSEVGRPSAVGRMSRRSMDGKALAKGYAGKQQHYQLVEEVAKNTSPLVGLQGLAEALQLVECVVLQNAYMSRLLRYRDMRPHAQEGGARDLIMSHPPDGPDDVEAVAQATQDVREALAMEGLDKAKEGVGMEVLWRWSCAAAAAMQTQCLTWNKVKTDLLAVGYADKNVNTKSPGHVAVFSLKSPSAPRFDFRTPSSITSMDFSRQNPHLLGVGCFDGSIAVYDVRARQEAPVIVADTLAAGKHRGPVWQVKWVCLGHGWDEVLISVSADGRVTQWSIHKGLQHKDLALLKRTSARSSSASATLSGPGRTAAKQQSLKSTTAQQQQQQSGEPIIARLSGGTSVDFSPLGEPSLYLVATDDGRVHQINTNFADQYIRSYSGHLGPIYRVAWSPFSFPYFLTASADWTLKLWHERQETALLTFPVGQDAVTDVAWSPALGTIFGATTAAGTTEIWDVATSVTQPLCRLSDPVGGADRTTCLSFATEAPVLAVGTSSGEVRVVHLTGLYVDAAEVHQDVQARHLQAAVEENLAATRAAAK
ncbi:hypothetical protein WJX73_005780 [Symbiochloris irregularis]|uniref:Dynein axonemal intermediate chain 4 n=1 Tax=Symbiochloris irregularis TaxID=706552 RepID=A0AAW1NTR0_9CHLO